MQKEINMQQMIIVKDIKMDVYQQAVDVYQQIHV
jgi:hypothetical protein